MKDTVVLYAGMGVGQLVPMVALAKLFLRHNLAVTIVAVDPPMTWGPSSKVISSFASANPSISFHLLPTIAIPAEISHCPFGTMFNILRGGNSNLLDFLVSISKTTSIRAVVIALFCTATLDVTKKLGLPTYFFITTSASEVAASLQVTVLDRTLSTSLKDMGRTPINIPGLPPVPATDLNMDVHDRSSDSYKAYVVNFRRYLEADGILVNTFVELESEAVKALRSGLWSSKMPLVYCMGPLITQGEDNSSEPKHECLTWLDSQPKGSVIFLCFGSRGAFLQEQINQLAIGLENSGQRFLWVVKLLDDPNKSTESQSEPNLDSILPDGFLDRTKDRGMVVKLWAPQVQVLQHEAVGGFVSHCGWNSTLEAITHGVPMICWPLYAEQRLNKVILMEEIKIAVVMDGYDEGLVRAEEVETKLRWLMESEGGKALKERMAAVKAKAAEALGEGGSSSKSFVHFLRDLVELDGKKNRN
ncbi:Glycosyltransferase [Rhynchospora pubera]|uniref:Glycosyltransferase n=2 Tax=Rhynchospora pubera TaxID=906938 RepID=A0AAV8FBW7_9POAL|nr:Glycosyltransferase [Rhynchospora pubera]